MDFEPPMELFSLYDSNKFEALKIITEKELWKGLMIQDVVPNTWCENGVEYTPFDKFNN